MVMNKYLADFFLCICFYILVFVIVLVSSNLNLMESLILIAYFTLSSFFSLLLRIFSVGLKRERFLSSIGITVFSHCA